MRCPRELSSPASASPWRAVYSRPELKGCWRTVAFGYGQPSRLLMQCGETVPDSEAFIESQMGVRQGDPLAAMLFFWPCTRCTRLRRA